MDRAAAEGLAATHAVRQAGQGAVHGLAAGAPRGLARDAPVPRPVPAVRAGHRPVPARHCRRADPPPIRTPPPRPFVHRLAQPDHKPNQINCHPRNFLGFLIFFGIRGLGDPGFRVNGGRFWCDAILVRLNLPQKKQMTTPVGVSHVQRPPHPAIQSLECKVFYLEQSGLNKQG